MTFDIIKGFKLYWDTIQKREINKLKIAASGDYFYVYKANIKDVRDDKEKRVLVVWLSEMFYWWVHLNGQKYLLELEKHWILFHKGQHSFQEIPKSVI